MPTNNPQKFAVIDIEATCVRGDRNAQQRFKKETIELPVVVITRSADGRRWLRGEDGSLETLEFRTFVRPVRNPVLSEFCTELTGIEQRQVDDAPTFSDAMASLDRWLADNDVTPENALFVSCGDFDLKHLRGESIATGTTLGRMFDRFCNVKIPFALAGEPAPRASPPRFDMAEMLEALGLELVGRHHSGIDDARNIARIAGALGEDAPDALYATGGFDAAGSFIRLV